MVREVGEEMGKKIKLPKFYVGETIRDAGRNETYIILERCETTYKAYEVTTGIVWNLEIKKESEKFYELIQPVEERLWR